MRKLIPALLCVPVLFLPLVFTQARQEPQPKQPSTAEKSKELFKEINAKLRSKQPKEVLEALEALQEMNRQLRDGAAPKILLNTLCSHPDPVVRLKAAQTLAEVSRTADDNMTATVKQLVKMLDDRDAEVRAGVSYEIGRMMPHAKEAMPKIFVALKDKDGEIRRAAYFVISQSLRHNKKLIPYVLAALDDPYMGPDDSGLNSVSQMAFDDLRFLKTEGKQAVQILTKVFESKKGSEEYRFHAIWTLSVVAPTERLPLETAREWLRDMSNPKRFHQGAAIICELGAHGKDAVPDLIKAATWKPHTDKATEQWLKMNIVSALQRIGPGARDALPTLEKLADTDDLILRQRVVDAIKTLRPNNPN